MIVVENGRDQVNKEVQITVTSVLQTSAGRMIFGRYDTPVRSSTTASSSSASPA
jgi:hypothetical protein